MGGKGSGGPGRGGGRPKNPDKARLAAELAELKRRHRATLDGPCAITAETALGFLGALWRDPSLPLGVRQRAALEVLPYEHHKLVAIEHTGKAGTAIEYTEVSAIERKRRVAALMLKLAEA